MQTYKSDYKGAGDSIGWSGCASFVCSAGNCSSRVARDASRTGLLYNESTSRLSQRKMIRRGDISLQSVQCPTGKRTWSKVVCEVVKFRIVENNVALFASCTLRNVPALPPTKTTGTERNLTSPGINRAKLWSSLAMSHVA